MDFQSPEDFVNGQVLLVDKPAGWTSFDVVNKLRNTLVGGLGLRKIKVGHRFCARLFSHCVGQHCVFTQPLIFSCLSCF